MLAQSTLFIVLCFAFGLRNTVIGLIVLSIGNHIMTNHQTRISATKQSVLSAIKRFYNQAKSLEGICIMNSNRKNITVTFTTEEQDNAALYLAKIISVGGIVGVEGGNMLLGGGRYNPAVQIYQTVKHMKPSEQIETLINREAPLSDYYKRLRAEHGDSKDAKAAIRLLVDKARQTYVEHGSFPQGVMDMLPPVDAAQKDAAKIAESANKPKPYSAKDAAKPASQPTKPASKLIADELYTVNDSLMVKVVKVQEGGKSYRVEMVKGEVLPLHSKAIIDGYKYTVTMSKQKSMTLSTQSLAERVKEAEATTTDKPKQEAKPTDIETRVNNIEGILAALAAKLL